MVATSPSMAKRAQERRARAARGVSSQKYSGADCEKATCSWGVHYNETGNVLGYFCRHKTSCTESTDMCEVWGMPELEQPKSLFGWTCKTNINSAIEEAASIAPRRGAPRTPQKEGTLLNSTSTIIRSVLTTGVPRPATPATRQAR